MNNSKLIPKIYCLRYYGKNEGCSPSKCSALKLKKLNLLNLIEKIDGKRKESIILDPFSPNQINIKDREIMLKNGLVVIDCSWNKILNLKRTNWKNGRKLPSFIAANPTNYGKWEKLCSAEAIAAALYITEFIDLSNKIISKFSWGNEFLKINNLLE